MFFFLVLHMITPSILLVLEGFKGHTRTHLSVLVYRSMLAGLDELLNLSREGVGKAGVLSWVDLPVNCPLTTIISSGVHIGRLQTCILRNGSCSVL